MVGPASVTNSVYLLAILAMSVKYVHYHYAYEHPVHVLTDQAHSWLYGKGCSSADAMHTWGMCSVELYRVRKHPLGKFETLQHYRQLQLVIITFLA